MGGGAPEELGRRTQEQIVVEEVISTVDEKIFVSVRQHGRMCTETGLWLPTAPRQCCGFFRVKFDVFSVPKIVTSERAIALVITMTRWWEALRASEVAKWQNKNHREWDTTDGRNGGAERIV